MPVPLMSTRRTRYSIHFDWAGAASPTIVAKQIRHVAVSQMSAGAKLRVSVSTRGWCPFAACPLPSYLFQGQVQCQRHAVPGTLSTRVLHGILLRRASKSAAALESVVYCRLYMVHMVGLTHCCGNLCGVSLGHHLPKVVLLSINGHVVTGQQGAQGEHSIAYTHTNSHSHI